MCDKLVPHALCEILWGRKIPCTFHLNEKAFEFHNNFFFIFILVNRRWGKNCTHSPGCESSPPLTYLSHMFSINLKFGLEWLFARNNTFWIKPFFSHDMRIFLPVAAEYFFAFSTSFWLGISLTHTKRMSFFNDLQLIYQTGSLG